ncbi:MAG: hypothetical protein ACFFE8_05195 [Candidatus Heimdallarchaeota archaeon]
MVNFFLFEKMLKDKEAFYTTLREEKGPVTTIRDAVLSITVFGALYGVTMGVWSWEPAQIVFSAIKVPLLFLISTIIVVPSFYVVNLTVGEQSGFLQLSALFLSSFSIATTVLLAFVPVNLFFMITSPRDVDSYFFMILLNLIIYGFGALISIVYMVEGARILGRQPGRVMTLKSLIPVAVALGTLAFIGTQLAWFIRPWFNYEPNFIRPEQYGNFYVAVFRVIFSRLYIGIIFLFIALVIMIPFVIWVTRILTSIPLTEKVEKKS